MAHSRSTRRRARDLYVDRGWSYRRVAEETGVGKTTLVRWARDEDWEELRELEREAHRKTREVLVRMLAAAEESGDPQAAYAAAQMSRVVGQGEHSEPAPGPTPEEVAVALIDVLVSHPEVGPAVRRHRREVVRLTMGELERLGGSGGSTS